MLRQVIKWLWFFELAAVVLLIVGFTQLLFTDFGSEATSDGVGDDYEYHDAADLEWRMKGAWVMLTVMLVDSFP